MKYSGLFGRTARRRCPHAQLTGIYGDPINHNGGWRLRCLDCGRYLDGPVSMADDVCCPYDCGHCHDGCGCPEDRNPEQ